MKLPRIGIGSRNLGKAFRMHCHALSLSLLDDINLCWVLGIGCLGGERKGKSQMEKQQHIAGLLLARRFQDPAANV